MQLVHNETLIYQAKPHWIYLARPVPFVAIGFLFLCCALLFSTQPATNQPPPPPEMINFFAGCGGCFFIFALILAVLIILGYMNADFYLTNKRVIAESGILSRSSKEIPLRQIESVIVFTPLVGRILGYGTVVISGSGGTKKVLPQIVKAEQVRHKIQDQIARL